MPSLRTSSIFQKGKKWDDLMARDAMKQSFQGAVIANHALIALRLTETLRGVMKQSPN